MRQGYDRFEVDQEIKDLHLELKQLHDKLKKANSNTKIAVEQYDHLKRRHRKLVNEIGVRERAAEEMSRLALREANEIIDTAYGNADMIVREAMSAARQLLVEIARISSESHEVRDELLEKVGALETVIKQLELPEIPKIKDLE